MTPQSRLVSRLLRFLLIFFQSEKTCVYIREEQDQSCPRQEKEISDEKSRSINCNESRLSNSQGTRLLQCCYWTRLLLLLWPFSIPFFSSFFSRHRRCRRCRREVCQETMMINHFDSACKAVVLYCATFSFASLFRSFPFSLSFFSFFFFSFFFFFFIDEYKKILLFLLYEHPFSFLIVRASE